MIPDAEAVKPALWDESAPASVPDPAAVKPIDWDDAEDGDWEAPLVPNPVCSAPGGGCGPWKQPQIRNPKYKGKWHAPLVANPRYKGVWAPRKVPNPGHFVDLHPHALAPMAGIAVEVWTTVAGIHFDNFYIGSSLKDAFAFAG